MSFSPTPRSIFFPVRFLALAALAAGPLFAASTAPALTLPRVSFNRDIRPIMSDTCFHCHGNDAKSREAHMRLDIREEALKTTRSGAIPIVPGNPEESEIIVRITSADDPMPPADAHKALTAAQKELFRRWVAEGAVYEPHWAYASLTRPAVPVVATIEAAEQGSKGAGEKKKSAAAATVLRSGTSTLAIAHNPIDAFIRATLAAKGIAPSPEAPKARLLRRLSLDLAGLPPTPEETAAFLADRSPNAYEEQVDRLLASPRHGERMAVWWLDIARFADTVGFHGDQNQRIFPYRDYVINAFNSNKRFDQFTIEQLAGDLLPSPTPEQIVATGYNRLNMMTREGGAQAKEYLAKYGAERVRSVAAAWFGSTFGCAECHDHKFDPIKTRDFYELQSFFADVKQWGIYSDYTYTPNPDLIGFTNDHPFPPEIEVDSPYLKTRQQRFAAELASQRSAAVASVANGPQAAAFAAWRDEARAFLARNSTGWQQPSIAAAHLKGRTLAAAEVDPNAPPMPPEPQAAIDVADGVIQLTHDLRRTDTLKVELKPGAGPVAALRLDFAHSPAADPKKKETSSLHVTRLTAAVRGVEGKERKLEFVFADANAKEVRYAGGTDILGVATGWKLPKDSAAPLVGAFLLASPTTLAADDTLVLTLQGDSLPPLRVFTSPFGATNPFEVASEALRTALQADSPTAAQNETLANAWLLSTAGDRAAFDRQHKLAASIREMRNGRAASMITQHADPFTVRVLARGNWQDESGAVVLPATPSFLPDRRESTPEHRLTRLDLAKYIVSKENPITSRVVMNRLWAMFFGTGLSAKVDDLGSQGELPSHPELLEWLASEFRDDGWDLRHMIRLIVTSATYRQSSSLRPELSDIDPGNRLLASQNPRRLEAEFIRDEALAVSGLLNARDIGGPSVKPYQPTGYYAALQFPDRDYVPSADDEQWRRGVYMHWQRTFLHPMLANFDAPARDECAATRTVSNTPQQALTLLNDPTFVEAARALAARIWNADGTDDVRLSNLFQLALERQPKPAEIASLKRLLATQRDTYRAAPADADKLLRIGLSPPPAGDHVELAAWTQVARVVLNSQEFLTRY